MIYSIINYCRDSDICANKLPKYFGKCINSFFLIICCVKLFFVLECLKLGLVLKSNEI